MKKASEDAKKFAEPVKEVELDIASYKDRHSEVGGSGEVGAWAKAISKHSEKDTDLRTYLIDTIVPQEVRGDNAFETGLQNSDTAKKWMAEQNAHAATVAATNLVSRADMARKEIAGVTKDGSNTDEEGKTRDLNNDGGSGSSPA